MLNLARRILVVICVGAIGATAGAELQNAIFNGTYIVKNEDRFVREWGLTDDRELEPSPPPTHLILRPYGLRSAYTCNAVDIPDRPEHPHSSNLSRVFLSFYVAVPSWQDNDNEHIDLTVYADDFPVLRREFNEPGFHLCLADLGPWAGKEISLRFNAGWFEGSAKKVVIALPRLLYWWGPHEDGHGGIGVRGSAHGFTPLGRLSESERDQYAKRVGVSFAPESCEWLAVRRIDCLTQSTIVTRWEGNWERLNLPAGYHWLPIMFSEGYDKRLDTQVIEGSAERGPVDVIPNFLRYDAGRLYFIAESMTYSKQ